MNTSLEDQSGQNLDYRQYFSLLIHWGWLILLVTAFCAFASYMVSKNMRPFFRSSTTVLVNEAPATQTTDYSSVLMSKQLTSTYAQMMTKDPVLAEVIDTVGIGNSISDMKEWITVTAIRDTQLIQVSVETTDPDFSAMIANTLVEVFTQQIQEIQIERFAQSKAALELQLSDTDKQIAYYALKLEKAKTEEERDSIEAKLAQYRSIYANLLLSYEQIRLSEAQSISSVVQIETATANPSPVRPNLYMNTLLAAVVGFLLATIAIILREALDDTIRTPQDITKRFKLPVLGVINHHGPNGDLPITMTDPRSPTAEAYRTLRTNVSYTSIDHPLKVIMVTSSEPGEGKSKTISNLGVVLAQNGNSVILADCDMRHPRLHAYFKLNNRVGMSMLFSRPELLKNVCQPTKTNGLSVITTGPLPPNPAELMGSKAMRSILAAIRQSVDVILIDTPPVLAVTDAAALASAVDGVLLVVLPGKTRFSAFQQTLDQLRQVNAHVLGVVLNNVVTKGKSYGYHYKEYRNYTAYQSYYGSTSKSKKGTKKEA